MIFLPEVRSRLLMLLSRQEAGHLANEQGKQQLVAQIKETLSAPLVKGQPKQGGQRCAVHRLHTAVITMGDSILSQAEIDALLNGDNTGDEPETVVGGKESEVKPYDPNTQRRVVRERLQALEIINERFCPAVPHGIVQPAAPQPGHHRRAD